MHVLMCPVIFIPQQISSIAKTQPRISNTQQLPHTPVAQLPLRDPHLEEVVTSSKYKCSLSDFLSVAIYVCDK